MRTVLFINAHSRRARRLSDKVLHDFSRPLKDFQIIEKIVVTNLKQLNDHLETLKAIPKLECVIIGSGDGTIVSVLNALEGRNDIVYGFLPLGTSNTFVRSLGLPLTYMGAKKVILQKKIAKASLGSVNGTLFANIAGIGIPAQVTETLSNKHKRIFGPFAYVISGVKALTGHTAFYCQIINDDIHESFYTHYLLFANGKYHGNLPLGKSISAYNGKLMLIAFGVSDRRWHNAITMIRLAFRQHEKDDRVRMIPFTRALITTHPQKSIEADGEIISRTPATVEIKENAIRVLRPGKPAKRPRKSGKTLR